MAPQYNAAMAASLDEILNSHRSGRGVVMGILNVTPDSFSDGGRFIAPAVAIEQARAMLAQGADIIDVGAESTRPGSDRVPAPQQIERLREVLPALAAAGAVVSIDTTLAPVAEFALGAGAKIINDVAAGRDDPEILAVAAGHRCPLVLMHMLGQPRTMQKNPAYTDVVAEVKAFLAERLDAAVAAGVAIDRCIVDPGLGFGKTLEHNLTLLAHMDAFTSLGRPILVGPSRKRFIGELTGEPAAQARVHGTIAACLDSFARGATIFRVHDVGPLVQALAVASAIRRQLAMRSVEKHR